MLNTVLALINCLAAELEELRSRGVVCAYRNRKRILRGSRELTNSYEIPWDSKCSDSTCHAGVKLTDLGYGPPALGFQCTVSRVSCGVSVENSTFSNVTAAGDSAILVGRSVPGCLAGCKLADVTFPNNDTAMALRASSNQVGCLSSFSGKVAAALQRVWRGGEWGALFPCVWTHHAPPAFRMTANYCSS